LYKVEKAVIADAVLIHKLVNHFAERGDMLARSLSEIYENIRDYSVVKQDGKLLACGALHINWVDLAEIKSLAVEEDYQKKGLGEQIVATCLKESGSLGIPTVFCLTYKPAVFLKKGFKEINKNDLPQKVWGECYRCPKFPDCDEIAMILHQ